MRTINLQGGLMKATLTIEASFIYPIIIVCSVVLIMYSFYAHDRLAVKSESYTILIKDFFDGETYSYDSKNNDYSDLYNEINDILDEVNLLNSNYSIAYDTKTDTLSLTNKRHGSSMNISFTNYERCTFIRRYYTIISAISSGKSEK